MNEDYVRAVLKAGRYLGVSERGIVIAFATVFVESDWLNYANSKVPESLVLPHDAVGSDGYSVGLFQQQVVMGASGWWWGDAETCMSPYKSALLFFGRLKRLDYDGPDSPGSYAQAVQQSAYPDRYDKRMADAQTLYDRTISTIAGGTVTTPDPSRPDFNEYPVVSPNSQDRSGTAVDLWLIHTQEGDGNADSLARWLANPANQVSYHYTISEDPDDHGVTVCDVVDTGRASWSALSANNRSINLCFAGSRAGWSRDQWLRQSKAIDVAAYLCARDCRRYGIEPRVIPPPYSLDPPGVSDHRYVTRRLGDGTHTDVGDGFPWDVLGAAIAKYTDLMGGAEPGQPRPPAPPTPSTPVPTQLDDRQLWQQTWDQLRGPAGDGWPQLGGKTPVDSLADLHRKVDRLTEMLLGAARDVK